MLFLQARVAADKEANLAGQKENGSGDAGENTFKQILDWAQICALFASRIKACDEKP